MAPTGPAWMGAAALQQDVPPKEPQHFPRRNRPRWIGVAAARQTAGSGMARALDRPVFGDAAAAVILVVGDAVLPPAAQHAGIALLPVGRSRPRGRDRAGS